MSKVIYGKRRSGKTTKLLQRVLFASTRKKRMFISPTIESAKYAMNRLCDDLTKESIEFKVNKSEMTVTFLGEVIYFDSFRNFMERRGEDRNNIAYVIDELEHCINCYFNQSKQPY